MRRSLFTAITIFWFVFGSSRSTCVDYIRWVGGKVAHHLQFPFFCAFAIVAVVRASRFLGVRSRKSASCYVQGSLASTRCG